MKKEILINIVDEQLSDGETDKLEVTTKGTMSSEGDSFTLKYDELDGEMEGSVTTLKIDSPTCVTVLREGSYNSQMIIEQDKRHNCYYDTPYGSFMMGVFAKKVSSGINENGGTLRMEYTVDFNSGLAAENTMTVTVTEI